MDVDYKTFRPVKAISLKGKIILSVIRFLYTIFSIPLKNKWLYPIPLHHEDPRLMKNKERLYLGYKYYHKAIIHAEKNSGLEEYFKKQNLDFSPSPDFIPQQTITLSAGGDLMPYECINKKVCASLWDDCGEFFFSSDIVFANLETPLDGSKPVSMVPEVMLNHMLFNTSEESFDVFNGNNQFKGLDVLSVANNHSLDQGSEGLKSTLHFLRERKIAYCGAALCEDEKFSFPIIERNGIRVAFIAFTYSLNQFTVPEDEPWLCNHILLNTENPDISPIIAQVNEARKKNADLIILSLHMGCAYQAYPSEHIVKNVHNICRQTGAEIILCSHPHNPQSIEKFQFDWEGQPRESLIAYSLGDFVAYDIYKWCHLPLMLKIHLAKGEENNLEKTIITKLEVKPVYTKATIKKGKIEQLKFLDYNQVKDHKALYLDDNYSKQEFEELQDFYERFLRTEEVSSARN